MHQRLFVFVLLIIVTSACRSSGEEAQTAEVAAAMPCPLARCVALGEAQSLLGFQPIEPSFLPDGWSLYSRRVESTELPPMVREIEARSRGIPISDVPLKSAPVLALEYRFQDSNFVPAITIAEHRTEEQVTSLSPETPGCATAVSLSTGTALYGMGAGRMQRGQTPGAWVGCAQQTPNDRQAHVVMLTRGNILVQIRAFPEAKITREDILKIAASLRPAP
jgi:hypothetical protein